MRDMRASGATERQMSDHVRESGGYNGVASGFSGGGNNATRAAQAVSTAPLSAQQIHANALNAAEKQRVTALKAQREGALKAKNDTGFLSGVNNAVSDFTSGLQGILAPLAAKGREAFKGSMYQTALDGTLGIFGGHKGETYLDSIEPNSMSGGDFTLEEYNARKERPAWDGFTYEMTDDERAASDYRDAADRRMLYRNGGGGIPMVNSAGEIVGYADSDDNRVYSNESRRDPYTGESLDKVGNGGTTAPLSGGNTGGNNGFIGGGGGFTRVGGGTPGNYFSAIPDGVFNSGGSPAIMNIQTSYGNGYNAADQWTASGNATRAAQAAATTGES